MKQVVHDNLNPFIGITFNERSDMMILWKFCARGTLQDVIYNNKIEFDSKFHAAFIRDLTQVFLLSFPHNVPRASSTSTVLRLASTEL